MTEERIDIEVQDKVSPKVADKLREIAKAAYAGDSAIAQLQRTISTLNVSALDKLSTAQARSVKAAAQQATSSAKVAEANAKVSLSLQKVATEAAKTDAALAKVALANQRVANTAKTATKDITLDAIAKERAAQAARNAQQEFNQLLGVNTRVAKSARDSAAAFQEQFAAQDAAAAKAREQAQNTPVVNRQRGFRQQNLFYQANDIGVGLASGQKPLTVFIQQGSQILGIYGANGGIRAGLALLKADLLALATAVAPFAAAAAALALPFVALRNEINKTAKTKVSIGDTFLASFQVAGAAIGKQLDKIAIDGIKVSSILGVAFKDFINNVAAIMASFVDIFNHAFDLIVANATLFAAKLYNSIAEKINDLIINAIPRLYNSFADLSNYITGLELRPKVELGQGALISPDAIKKLEEGADTVGKIFADGLSANFSKDYVKAGADALSAQAQKNALADQKNKARKTTFADIVKEYQVEIAGLRNVGAARERILAIGEAEKKLHRELTAGEKARLSVLVDTVGQLKLVNELNQPIQDLQGQLPLLNQALKDNDITTTQYTRRVNDLKIAVLSLSDTLSSGLQRGLLTVQQQFGSVADVASNAVVNSFQSAEDALVKFVQTGKLKVGDLVDSMLADFARLAIRQSITGPLANIFGNLVGSVIAGSSGGGGVANAGVTDITYGSSNNASGTILSAATNMGVYGGKRQIGGEAGSEALLPLRRDSKGNLGVMSASNDNTPNVSVTVINNAPNSKATATEKRDNNGGKSIEVVIDEIGAAMISKPGSAMNKAMGNTFGVSQQLASR